MNCGRVVDGPEGAISPSFGHCGGDLLHRPCIIVPWTEVPGGSEMGFSGKQALGEREISGQGFQDVLPWTNRFWAANQNGFPGTESANQVGDQAIAGPIAATDNIACPGGREKDAMPA